MTRRPALQGDELPAIGVRPPGPRSRAAVRRLRRAEGAAIWGGEEPPIVWSRARGAVVEDVDGNRYVDLTSGFGAATLGHAPPGVRRAVAAQAGRLVQGLGDLQPHVPRERLIRRLATLGGTLDRVLLASTGSEAVELALKTAAVATGRRRVIAFTGAYHGATYGALEVTDFPAPPRALRSQRSGWAIRAPYPAAYRCALAEPCAPGACDRRCLDETVRRMDEARSGPDPPGAVLLEPIQGRAGVIVPPPWYLPAVCRAARERDLLVIYDEVMTGAGRTGPFWAWERWGRDAEPDLMAVGKGLGGGVAIAALLGRRELMDSWRAERTASGEAPHASTFYAHPLACAGALAALRRLTSADLREGVERLGGILAAGLARLASRHAVVGEVRSAGMMAGVELVRDRDTREPDPGALRTLVAALLERGVLAVPSGIHGNVLSLLPPLTIAEPQLAFALEAIDAALAALPRS
jgi:4-aminobutyrate aminotransferase/(S)-3-amino-2-methylpropionate transaminase